jgi:hypothetical protein
LGVVPAAPPGISSLESASAYGGASSSPIQSISCKRTSLIENDCNLGPQTLCALYYACCALVIFPNAKQQIYM